MKVNLGLRIEMGIKSSSHACEKKREVMLSNNIVQGWEVNHMADHRMHVKNRRNVGKKTSWKSLCQIYVIQFTRMDLLFLNKTT